MARKQFRDGLAATAAEARADPLALYFGPAEPAAAAAPAAERLAPHSRRPRARRRAPAPASSPSSADTPPPIDPPARPDDGAARDMLVQVATLIPPELEQSLHRLAYRRGGEAAKSVVAREAVTALLDELGTLEGDDRDAALERLRVEAQAQVGGTPRMYRLTGEMRARLLELAALERIPMAAALRVALARLLASAEPGESR